MAEDLQDEILEFKEYKEFNISYPVIVTRWEIKQVRGLNKQYLQVYFQKLDNNVKAFQLNINCYSTFGKELERLSNIPIQDIDKKERRFSQVIPLTADTRKVEIFICQCLLVDGSIIEKNERQMVVYTFKPFAEEETVAGKKLLPCSIGYPIDNTTHWYCACGTLNLKDSRKCFACGNEKSKVIQLITKENIQKEKEDIKQKELEKQKELDEQNRKKQKQIKLITAIGIPLAVVLILTIILVSTLVPFNTVESNNMTFVKVGDTYQLKSFSGDSAELKVPAKIRGRAVTSIGEYAFIHCSSNLKSVEIPSSVTSIEHGAFSGSINLTNVTFGDNSQLTSIGADVFRECSKLTSIEIPSSVTSIGNWAFDDCSSLTSVTFGDNSQLTSIGDWAFNGCSSLTSIEIPSGVMNIGNNAFYKCSKLTSAEISSSVISIGKSAFRECTSLKSVTFGDNSQLTTIGEWAFSDCRLLESILIPSNVTSVGTYAFNSCYRLTIYCETESKPSGWDRSWNSSNRTVIWGYRK